MRKSKTQKLAAALTAGLLMGSGTAQAGGGGLGATNFTQVTDAITSSSSNLPNLISTVAYVGGLGLGVAGIFKLKQHVDNPGQTPMKDGLIRLGAGGGLLALPAVVDAMQGTIDQTGAGAGIADVTFTGVSFGG